MAFEKYITKLDEGVYAFGPSEVDVMTTKELEESLKSSGKWNHLLEVIKNYGNEASNSYS